jgi:hypothetical protein
MLARLVLIALSCAVLLFAGDAPAACTKEDCKKNCYRKAWKAKFDDPACRKACEARNALCTTTGAEIPTIPGVPEPHVIPPDPKEVFYGTCGIPFQSLTGVVRAQCANYDDRMENYQSVKNAGSILVAAGLFTVSELDSVRIRWCPLNGAVGMSPFQGTVYLDTALQGAHVLEIASTLAHELQHERQWRSHGGSFPCKYSEAYSKCKGCQTRSNRFEQEAYQLEDQFWNIANQYGTRCLKYAGGTCGMQYTNQYVGTMCECPAPGRQADLGLVTR